MAAASRRYERGRAGVCHAAGPHPAWGARRRHAPRPRVLRGGGAGERRGGGRRAERSGPRLRRGLVARWAGPQRGGGRLWCPGERGLASGGEAGAPGGRWEAALSGWRVEEGGRSGLERGGERLGKKDLGLVWWRNGLEQQEEAERTRACSVVGVRCGRVEMQSRWGGGIEVVSQGEAVREGRALGRRGLSVGTVG